jgi:hypothetical protein
LYLLGLALVALPSTGCDGEGPGGNQNGDANALDAGVDSQVPPDAWTFDCPSSQPDGTFCLRGYVRNILDDEVVPVPPGTRIQRLVAEAPGGFPTVVESETEVAEDGRFIFPAVVPMMVHDNKEDLDYHARDDATYDHFDLLLDGEIPGFVSPQNKYGVVTHDWFLNYYTVSATAIEHWEGAWPVWPQEVPFDAQCSYTPLDVLGGIKTVLGICYGEDDEWFVYPHTVPNGIHPIDRIFEGTDVSCLGPLTLDRLTFYDGSDHTWRNGAVGLVIATSPVPSQEDGFYVTCGDLYDAFSGGPLRFPTYGKVGPAELDPSSPFVVVHSLLP